VCGAWQSCFREQPATSAAPAGTEYQQATRYLPVEPGVALEVSEP
jgi:hypothetical protein